MHETEPRTCITCQQETPPETQAFTVVNGGCVCAACWEQEPGIDTTGERYASHKAVKRFMLEHDGPWWVFPEPEPGKAQMRAIATVTPPVQGFCRHCGVKVPPDQLASESTVEGTPLRWLGSHCWRCYELAPECPDTCTFIEEGVHA